MTTLVNWMGSTLVNWEGWNSLAVNWVGLNTMVNLEG